MKDKLVVFNLIAKRAYISSIVDNRSNEGGLIAVTLKEGYFFKDQPDVNRQSYSTFRQTHAGCSKNNVFNPEEDMKKAEPKVQKVKVPKVAKASKAPEVQVTKSDKVLSQTPDAIRKRAKRAAQKVAS